MGNITWGEISTHNSPDNCWVVIDGSVYDLTSWVSHHTGGDIIAVLAGEDASSLFHSSHLQDLSPMLKKFKIGDVENYQSEFSVTNDKFLSLLKQRVYQYCETRKVNLRNTRQNKIQIFYSATLLVTCWFLMYFASSWGFLASFPMGLATCSLIGSFGHEQIHGNLWARNPKRSLTSNIANDMLWGLFIPFMPERFFQYEHIKHHNYPMAPNSDYDIYALKDFVRLSPELKAKPYHVFQHLYAPFVYGAYIFLQLVYGYASSFFRARNLLKDKGAIRSIVTSSTVAVCFHILLPIYLTNAWWVLLCASSYFFVWQAAIYFTSGVPHMTEAATNNQEQKSWALHVCQTTKSLKCGNHFFDWVTGGLNYHLAHHLLPCVPRDHLPKIAPIVEQTCRDFGYTYYTYTSLWAYCRDHYKFLYTMGHPGIMTNQEASAHSHAGEQL